MNAIVLSGGGAHGDFEVGAVRRLYELGFTPDLIASTSVGSINGAKLAEGENRGGSPSGLVGLERIWLALNTNADMYTPNPAFNTEKVLDDLRAAGVDILANLAALGLFGTLALPILIIYDLAKTKPDIEKVWGALQQLLAARSLFLLDPIHTLLLNPKNLDPGKVATSGIKLQLAVVSLETGDLRYVDSQGAMTQADTRTPVIETPTIDPQCQPLAEAVELARAELNSAETDVGDSTEAGRASAQAAVLRARQALAAAKASLASCNRDHPGQGQQLKVAVVDAVMASASMPFIFVPVKLGTDNYVDGGVRSITPIRSALLAGATTVWAVISGQKQIGLAVDPISQNRISSFDSANLFAVAARAAEDIMPAQIDDAETDPIGGWGGATVTKIRPEVDIHNIMTIDPGLIRIRIAHGYMRADDVAAARAQMPSGEGYLALADELTSFRRTTEITLLRKQTWINEFAANGWAYHESPDGTLQPPTQLPGGPNPAALAGVRSDKRLLKRLVGYRSINGGALPNIPTPPERWWLDWEAHSWAPVVALWDAQNPFAPPATHFYTTDATERQNAIQNLGFTDEGIACYVFTAPPAGPAPLFRAYHPTGAHFYTMRMTERDNATNHLGYSAEGIACYIDAQQSPSEVPLYRAYHQASDDHFYTTDLAEHNNAVQNLGYIDEHITGYVRASADADVVAFYRLYGSG